MSLLLLHQLGILRVAVAECGFLQLFQRHSFLQELLRFREAAKLLKRSKIRFVLLLDLALLVHRFRGESTWAMKIQVGIERLSVECLDLLCLLLRDIGVFQ